MKEFKPPATQQAPAELVSPGGASDSHRHTYASLLNKPFLGAMAFASLPAGASSMDGKYAVDTTNHRLVWYEGGKRYASAAGAVV